jgi:signal transduction histidine kinase
MKSLVLSNQSTGQSLELRHLAHDLRGPLNSILGFSELLIDGIEGPLNEYQYADITAIYQSAGNLLRLIDAVVDLSRCEANELSLSFESVDLYEVIDNILIHDFGSTKPETIALTTDLPDDLPPVHGQADRIEQMIIDLVRFGFKLDTDQITIGGRYDDVFVTIVVDVGPEVISAEELEMIFQLVVTTDSAGHTHLTRGRIELPLIRRLAEIHNGRVWGESTETGTRFHLELPRR